MKKIYVLGNFNSKGIIGNDSDDLDSYMELGWEQLTTGFWAKLNLSNEDYICTTRDRLFMYSHITKNLIAWEDFNHNDGFEIIPVYRQKFDLLKKYNDDIKIWPKEMIDSLKLNDFPVIDEENYVCVQIRRRSHCGWRNGPTHEWENLVEQLSKKYNKVYVVGKGNEDIKFSNNVEYVSIQKFCSLIKSKGCVASFGSSSGCSMLNLLYGRKELPVHILFTENPEILEKDHILFFSNRINVANTSPKYYFNFTDLYQNSLK
jgi:hypothetical protein